MIYFKVIKLTMCIPLFKWLPNQWLHGNILALYCLPRKNLWLKRSLSDRWKALVECLSHTHYHFLVESKTLLNHNKNLSLFICFLLCFGAVHICTVKASKMCCFTPFSFFRLLTACKAPWTALCRISTIQTNVCYLAMHL